MKQKLFYFYLLSFSIAVLMQQQVRAQQMVVDSSLLDRINALEQRDSYRHESDDHFMVAGLATLGFASSKTTNTVGGTSTVNKSNSFPDADNFEVSPMLLWRHGKKFLVEFEPSFNADGLTVNWGDVSWFAAPGLIVRGGYLVLPYGTYSKREAAGWIDKLATDPMGIADMAPTDFGVEVEGGLPMGNMKMSYDVALSNGNQLLPDGTLSSGNFIDNNKNKTVTARFALLPFSNSSLELGVSGMFGKVGDEGSAWQSKSSQSYAFDLNYVHLFSPVLLNIKSQYNIQNIDKTDLINPADSTTYTFKNKTNGFFAQASLRPTGANSFIKDLEIAGRYTQFNTPSGSTFGADQHSLSVGLDYWFSWRAVFKITYEAYKGKSTAFGDNNTGNTTTNSLFVHFAIQL